MAHGEKMLSFQDAWGNDVALKVTEDNGMLAFTGLLLGTYYIKEPDAPDGYEMDPDYHEVMLDYDTISEEDVITIEVSNYPETPPPLPPPPPPVITTAGIIEVPAFTGVDSIIPISGISAFIGGIALIAASL